MRQIILDFPKQFEEGLKLARNIKIEGEFENVIFSGMGGSAWPAEILISSSLFCGRQKRDELDIFVNRTYNLPSQTTKKTLAIFSSYSGNTEEPLACFQEALKRKLKIAAITSGGQLKKLCQKNNTPYAEIPKGLVPRMATGYIFTALYSILANKGIIPKQSTEILAMAKNLKPAEQEKQGQKLAKKLVGKIPLIYTSDKLKTLGYIWKIKLNENAKVPAFCNYFPELNHNEMIGYFGSSTTKTSFYLIILQDPDDQPKILKRMNLTVELIRSRNIPVEMIEIKGQTLLEKIFSAILLADWVSYYLALEYRVDPLSTEIQEEFKKKMAIDGKNL